MLEGQTQEIRLDDVEARIFGFFVHWLYTQSQCGLGTPRTLIEHAKFYCLADRFMVERLKKSLLVHLAWMGPNDAPESGDTLKDFQHFAYGTHGDETLRKEAVSKTQLTLTRDNIEKTRAGFPDGMLADFTDAVSRDWLRVRERLDTLQNGFIEFVDDVLDGIE